MASDLVAVENRLWATADQLWANTGLKPSEFSTPVLGLIFLRYADKRFTDLTQALGDQGTLADEILQPFHGRIFDPACGSGDVREANTYCEDPHKAVSGKDGRLDFVMANSAGDARGSELEIRKKQIQSGAVDVIVSFGPNFFFTVVLPCTLWFFDRGKARGPRKDKVQYLSKRWLSQPWSWRR